MPFSITNRTKGSLSPLKRLPFALIKEAVLGKEYDLSLVIVTASEMKKINGEYRNKPVPTDILSFPLDPESGEMFICLAESRKEAKKFEREFLNFLPFLFIHGCVHLKGFTHGSTMEREERKFRTLFEI